MNLEDFRTYCLSLPGTDESLPFGPDTLVFKVKNKLFALMGLDEPEPRANLKCDPARALELRDTHEAVIPGWHMNKKHWNTVYFERDATDELIYQLIDHSYALVVAGLPKKVREELAAEQ
ncbi:MAG: MmcQ/YjbR family DNA-binding protein [Saprospiraceae bacterium]